MARMRTIAKAVEEIRNGDPGTCITETTLRTWLKMGMIPHVMVGRVALLNMDELEKFLESGIVA